MIRQTAILTVLSLTVSQISVAQAGRDTLLKGNTIEIIQSYKPIVKKAPKPEWMPQLPAADTFRPLLSLDVPQQTLYYSYNSGQLKPLALGKDSVPDAYPNYIKAGAGNLATLFLDAGIGGIKAKNLESSIRLHHLSQKGSIAGQQTAQSGLEAEGLMQLKNAALRSTFSVERDQYYYYGYDHDRFNYNIDSLKQVYTTVRAAVELKKTLLWNGKNVATEPKLDIGYYGGKANSSEIGFNLTVPAVYSIDSFLDAYLAVNASVTALNYNGNAINNNLVSLVPGVQLHKAHLSGHGYLALALGRSGNFYVLPDIQAAFAIPSTQLSLSGGWQSGVRKNTYEQLTIENPYLNAGTMGVQSRQDELFAGVAGPAGKHINWTLRASWWNYDNLPVYLNMFSPRQYFNVEYDKVSAFALRAAGRYTQAGKWSAGLDVNFYQYYQGSLQHAWHQPSLQMKGDINVQPIEKLWISGYTFYLDGIHSINATGLVIKHDPILDIGLGANYAIHNRLNIFLQVNNVLNSKYQRWQGYEAYGINLYGGLQLKF